MSKIDPHAPRVVGAEQKVLEMFVGHWTVAGENSPSSPAAFGDKVTGSASYEWLPGEFFLIMRWDRRFASGGKHVGTGLIGYDPETSAHSSYAVDNLGFARTYRLSVDGRKWTYSGECERATVSFSDDGDTFEESWEMSKDGATWQPLCMLHGTRFR